MAVRRGVMFTLMAIIVVAFLLSSERLVHGTYTTTKADSEAAATRIAVVNTFIDTFEKHAANMLGTAGYFALKNLSKKIAIDNEFILGINDTLTQCLVRDRLIMGGSTHSCLPGTHRLNDSLNTLIQLASSELGISTVYVIKDIWVTEEEPFVVTFWMNMSYNLTDPFVSWIIEHTVVSASVDIIGIEDPVYQKLTATGNVSRTRQFTRTTIKQPEFHLDSFKSFYYNESYTINYGKSPSVVQRFIGDLTNSSCCGVESVVNWTTLPVSVQTDFNRKNWSYIDFLFHDRVLFNCGSESGQIVDLPFPHSNIRIDQDRILNYYNLTGNASFTC